MKKIEALLLGLVEYDKKTAPSDITKALANLIRDHDLLDVYTEKKTGLAANMIKLSAILDDLDTVSMRLEEAEKDVLNSTKPTKPS